MATTKCLKDSGDATHRHSCPHPCPERGRKGNLPKASGACLAAKPVRFHVIAVSPIVHALFMDYSFVYTELCFHSFNLLNSGKHYLAKVAQLVERG